MLDDGELDSDKLIHKLERCVHDYFGSKYNLKDFNLKKNLFKHGNAKGRIFLIANYS